MEGFVRFNDVVEDDDVKSPPPPFITWLFFDIEIISGFINVARGSVVKLRLLYGCELAVDMVF
ncbi:unnamed protein product [Schistosoma margrebowiei]|uniref:Uncharacterized protein n=1 Tax=Schistosoma margrebowiei TaxID=48269 RepID=A0A183LG23_9TREM|nr:unnamed protein product [Schistosoma margrebowiei]